MPNNSLICQICNKRNHIALKFFNRFNHSYQADTIPQALAAITIANTQDTNWFPNTIATDHVTNNTDILQDLTLYTGSYGLMVGNGISLPITHVGNTSVGSGSSSIHLVSIIKLTTDYPLTIEFNGNGFVIKDRATQMEIARRQRYCRLYTFHGDPSAYFSNCFHKTGPNPWHLCLGQPHHQVLEHLHSYKRICFDTTKSTYASFCVSCQIGKSCRLLFLPHDNQIKIPFHKIHCELWGFAPTASCDKFHFYNISIDEYTNFTTSWN